MARERPEKQPSLASDNSPEAIAEERIAEAMRTGATQLRLSHLGLTTLPASIAKLRHLRALFLHDNELRDLSPSLSGLKELQILDLRNNKFCELPVFVGEFEKLQELYLGSNEFRNLNAFITQLKNLQALGLADNQLRELPAAIGELKHLRALHLNDNKFRGLPDSIGTLKQLEHLYLNGNHLRELPTSFAELRQLRSLNLQGNSDLGLPQEIIAKRDSPTEILDYYFRIHPPEAELGIAVNAASTLRELKMILVGRGEVGKSSLVDVLQGMPFVPGKAPTEGIAITAWKVDLSDGQATALVWDFGGQEIMHGTHQFFLTHRSLYLVVLDGRGDTQNREAEYWLKYVRAFGGDSPVFVVMNKQRAHAYDIDREKHARKYGVPPENFFRTDCEDATSITEMREAILAQATRMLTTDELFPPEFWAVKERLGAMKQNGEDFLSDTDYRRLCRELGVQEKEGRDEYATALRWLTNLGIVVSFPDDVRLSELTVLNPEWVTDGIYRVLTNTKLRDQKHGELSLRSLRDILPGERWPRDRHRYLTDLMQKFELCFRLEGDSDTLLVPELLPDREPRLHDWDPAQCLVFLYKYPVLPHGVLPRFLTRTHEHSRDRERWRSGVVLEWRGAEAVVRADYDANEVSIWVRGPHADLRRNLLTLVRSHFDAIHKRIEGLAQEIDERVAVPGHPEVTLSFNDLLLDERAPANRETVRVTIAGERVDWSLDELLNGVESPELRARRREEERLGGSQIHHHHYRSNAQPTFPMGDNINMPISGGTFHGPVAAKMQDCISIIGQQANDERKQLLQTLQREAGELIQKLPANKQEEAADNLKLLVESATSEKPKRPWYSVSAQGLMEASKFTKDFTGNIAGTLGQLGKLVWPDFVLSGSGTNEK